MRILKIKGKDEQVIKQQIENEYGGSAIILSTHQERPQGLLGLLKKPYYSVTIAVEEDVKVEQIPHDLTQSLDALKVQMDYLREELKATKHSTNRENSVHQPQAHNTLGKMFEEKLIGEGVQPEVIKGLLGDLTEEMGIDEIVRLLYTQIISCFTKANLTEPNKKVFFIGPTGVGKTTTIAKLTADKVLNSHEKVVLLTADTYRIAAIEQLRTYAEILDVPIEIVYEDKDLNSYLEKWESNANCIFVDTAGRSHKNVDQMSHMKTLLDEVQDKKVYLVLNMNTQFKDIKQIIANYERLTPDFEVIVTKSDETDVIGNLLNIACCAKRPIAYITTGQSVPDDFIVFDHHEYTKDLLRRISYE